MTEPLPGRIPPGQSGLRRSGRAGSRRTGPAQPTQSQHGQPEHAQSQHGQSQHGQSQHGQPQHGHAQLDDPGYQPRGPALRAGQHAPPRPGRSAAGQRGQAAELAGAEAMALARLSTTEKVLLVTGADSWRTQGADAIGLRPMITSDGPAGVRGIVLDERLPSSSLPCPAALGATWDASLVYEVASALGAEARGKGVDVLLGPTINLMRTPLGGRGFECFAEDPLLTARLAVAFVGGVQDQGVAATVKHYVGNDSETSRWTYDARIDEQVLRELYLAPFEACVTEAGVALVMAAYNKVNGMPMTEHAGLLAGLLKGEWGFDGVVISDWHAARSTTATALATLDLSMPGPDGPWGALLASAVQDGLVDERVLDDKVLRLLRLARRVGALDVTAGLTGGRRAAGAGAAGGQAARSEGAASPGDGHPADGTRGNALVRPLADRHLLRRAAAASFVLLRDEHGVLPLTPGSAGRVLITGPNAFWPTVQGGGSAGVHPVSVSDPAGALAAAFGAVAGTDTGRQRTAVPGTAGPGLVAGPGTTAGPGERVTAVPGCQTWVLVPEPPAGTLRDPVTGEPGLRLDFRAADGTLLGTEHRTTAALAWWDGVPEGIGWGEGGRVVLTARYRPAASGAHLLGAAGVGRLALTVDGVVLADEQTERPADPVQAMTRPGEVRAGALLEGGRDTLVQLEFSPAADGEGPLAVRLGITPATDDDQLLAEAEQAAASCDTAIVVVGSAALTESEGFDRSSLSLPGRQDELIRRVAAACRRTIVVVNSGMPVLMPWADDVAAVLQAWLPGQEMGGALADVLLGVAEPGGRLPVTIPAAAADCPVLHAEPDQAGQLRYDEGLLIGYRGYDRAGSTPRFPFGHGLGYTTWAYESLQVAGQGDAAGREGDLAVTVTVRNTGARRGKEVVQAYLAGPPGDARRPVRTLAAFAAVSADPGEAVRVALVLPARAFARYDTGAAAWVPERGAFTVQVGRSSRDLRLALPLPARRTG
ncbi:MAG TPA: glycoside hydrolase family 3 C-terminal domain-containing protein [Streptosporangiaceae bacterium]